MPLSREQISKALAEGKHVLCREIVSAEVYAESIFEDCWSRLIRLKQVPAKRGVLHENTLALFRRKLAAGEITHRGVIKWLRSVLDVEIESPNT